MKKTLLGTIVSLCCVSVAFAGGAGEGTITGSYVEVRSNDVFVGLCFSNSETLGLVGREGTMAWKVDSGSYNGVSLDGLSVVAVILANSTLGEQFSDPYPIRSVLIVDSRASVPQRAALRAMARTSAGDMLGTVVQEEIAPIRFTSNAAASHGMRHMIGLPHSDVLPVTSVQAGSWVNIETRELRHSDDLCANPEVVYNPLATGMRRATPVFTKQMVFTGSGLGATWSIPGARSGWVADFELSSAPISR
jgi:hypothetical protein